MITNHKKEIVCFRLVNSMNVKLTRDRSATEYVEQTIDSELRKV